MERVAALRMPAMYQWPEVAEEGGFAAYGPRFLQLYRDVLPRQLVQLFRGVKPADIPIEQPTSSDVLCQAPRVQRARLSTCANVGVVRR